MAEKFTEAKIIGLDIDSLMLEKAKLRIKPTGSSTLATSLNREDQVECVQKSYADIQDIL
jgi:ubiquinone/menaquinone biosynthesis C-methylase UbiE